MDLRIELGGRGVEMGQYLQSPIDLGESQGSQRRRGKQKGNVAGAHKLLKIVSAVLKRGTSYTPERPSPVRPSAKS